MKRTFITLGFLWIVINAFQVNNALAQECCPEFELRDAVEICPPPETCKGDDPVGQGFRGFTACKESVHTYTVFPNLPGYTYTWTVTNGTAANPTGNPNPVLWGLGSTGFIKVIISNVASGGNCIDSLMMEICLLDGPNADFILTPDTVCQNSLVSFTNTSSGGSVYHWDFGDGTDTTATHPTHTYGSPGTYIVTLTATDMGAGDTIYFQGSDLPVIVPCGCSDTISKIVVVLPGEGPVITTDYCYGTVCPGDTSSFCTPIVCGTYNWTVTGGTVISGAGSSCIEVKWDNTYSAPTTVSLKLPNCGSAPCPGITTINVPVLYPDLPIIGPTNLCAGASGTYSLPLLPGTYYTWAVTGGMYSFNQQDRNTPDVNITFNFSGTYWVKCDYDNPLAGCSGVDSIQVNVLPQYTIFGDDVVCEGNTTTYFGSGGATWSIFPAGPVIVGSGSSASVTWVPGTYTITAIPTNLPLFCNSIASFNVEVIPLPVLNGITGPDSICPGDNYTYFISSDVSGFPFNWSITNGSGFIHSEMGADKDSVIVEWTGAGPWELSVYQETELAFCTSLTETLTVNPYLPPVITGVGSACVDATEVYLAGGSNPYGDFQWSIMPAGQGTILSGQTTGSVNILWHGPAATATLSVTTCSGTDSFLVTINGPPTAIAAYDMLPVFCLGDSYVLTLSTPSGPYTYQWYKDGTPITLGTSSSLAVNIALFGTAGTFQYYVEVTENGCTSKSNIINVVIEDCTVIGPGGGGGGCDAYAFFRAYVVCDTVYIVDKSWADPPSVITGYSWAVTPSGTFWPSNTDPNPTLSVPVSGPYTITLTVTSSSGCTSEWIEVVDVLLPNAGFIFPSPVCANSPATFTANPNNPNYFYDWDFGDGYTSSIPVTDHAYGIPSPPPYNVSLIIQDSMGCVAIASNLITVDSVPSCSIVSDTLICPGDSIPLTACSGMATYQWYKDGNAIAGANAMTYYAGQHGEYWVEVSNTYGCYNNSDSVFLYMNPLPVANITGPKTICTLAGAVDPFNLYTVYNADYSYVWSSIPGGVVFTPPNANSTMVGLTVTSFPTIYQFVVEVTDVNTGCTNSDTLCVAFFETPTLTLPYLSVCEGSPVTLTPNPNDPAMYSYQWNMGATTPVIIASTPGYYGLTMTDKETGCFVHEDAGFIYPKPDLSLFPIGCENICDNDTLHLYIPLALNAIYPNDTYPSAYPWINWYIDGDYGTSIGTGENLDYTGGASGNHQFSVVVQNSFGCSDTSDVFYLAIDTVLSIIVSSETSCGCDTTISFNIVDASSGNIVGHYNVDDCVDTFSICVNDKLIYDIVVSNGIVINNAIVSGVVTYPEGGPPFYIADEGLCCFAAVDSLFVHINSSVIYTNDVTWDNKYYLADSVIVTMSAGSVLDITNVDVVFGECAGIVFQDSSYLRTNNSVFRPCNINGTWKGLRFDGSGEFDNIINESTFKNAEVALYFQNGADGVISNNLFSNCNYGIRVEGNNDFNHPISGNRFVTESFYPFFECGGKYTFVDNSSTYGVYSTSSRFLGQVSHNEFVNTFGVGYPRTYGVYQMNGGGLFSENTFTDITYSIYINSALFPTNIENNDIEINIPAIFSPAAINVNNCVNPIVEINNNNIVNNSNQYNSFSAVYARSSSNISIVKNSIDGFRYGVIAVWGRNFQISNNEINECDVTGIYFLSPYGDQTPNYITCNTIRMRDYDNTRGLFAVNIPRSSVVTNNCITDSYTAMDFRSYAGYVDLPLIRNNFLYNYSYVGINVWGHSGNIGTNSDPGMNTLYSNNNSALDINSQMTITAADNFGMINLSATVVVTSNSPFYSTASCGHQIFELPSQGNLNTSYTCDHFANIAKPLEGGYGVFSLIENYEEMLLSASNQYTLAEMILASVSSPDLGMLNNILDNTNLTEKEEAQLKYKFFYRKSDYQGARANLDLFVPQNDDEADYKALRMFDLDLIESGWGGFTDSDVQFAEAVLDKGTYNANFAVSLLNNTDTYRDYISDEIELPDVEKSGNIKQLTDGESYLNIFPNPATDKAYIELLHNNGLPGILKMFDASGKMITDFNVKFVSGGIEMDIRQLDDGLYFITLSDIETGFLKTGKLVKMKK
ncbi:MAG: PKD domain-containing protein [Chlorobi bacterium]|nr:PKD domain-containing protein [Chlorobiota bacterium]